MAIPKKSGGVRITVNYKKLSQIIILSQLPISRVDQVLDSLGKGRVFSLFDLLSFRSVRLPRPGTTFLSRRFALPRAYMSGSSCPREAAFRPAGS